MNNSDQTNSSLFLSENCDELQKKFSELNEPRDVARMLDISYTRLVYHIYEVSDSDKYKEFSIAKKSGGLRTISAPSTAIKIIQRKLSQVLYSVYVPKAPVHGFVPNRSIVTNANQHIRKRFVLNIDIEDFFGSIHFGRVRGIFMAPPYRLSANVATVLAQICCFSDKLPQGAPTSPVVSNMVCARLDSQLRLLAKDLKCTFTRYADDITFSTTLSTFPKSLAYIERDAEDCPQKTILGERLLSLIKDNGFAINWKKVRLQHSNHHQEVTGITVNQFPNVKRKFIREISMMLHVWDKWGIESARGGYIKKQVREGSTPEKISAPFEEVLRGKLNFLKMVKGKDDPIYQKYLGKYLELYSRLS